MQRGKMIAVIGAQYGSEGKGVITHSIANEYDVHVRVGSPNAGHTFYWNGEKHVMQSIPCGWTNPTAMMVIGRGALINMKLLMQEIEHIEQYYPDFRKTRLIIDSKAGVLDEKFHQIEGGTAGEMHKRIGSTGEGVGPARVARINRNPDDFYFFEKVAEEYGLVGCMRSDTPHMLACMQDRGYNILLEGTQGSALSLLHSFWPYCTSIDTNAAQILAECGIAPSRLTSVLLVARTFPIRVAGTSGPMKNETTWEAISERFGRPMQERTTVTKKVRRIAEWDDDLIESALILNGPTSFAITFMDYIDPKIEGVSKISDLISSPIAADFINSFSIKFGVPVSIVGTGGPETSTVRLMQEL